MTDTPAELRKQLPTRDTFIRAAAAAPEGPCIIWPYYKDGKGYGHTRFAGVRHTAQWVSCFLRHGPPPKGAQAAHLCHTNSCCNGAHLEWQTPAENMAASVALGRHAHGERNAKAKLTEEEVVQLRRDYATGNYSQRELGAAYGISGPNAHQIIHRRHWRHVA